MKSLKKLSLLIVTAFCLQQNSAFAAQPVMVSQRVFGNITLGFSLFESAEDICQKAINLALTRACTYRGMSGIKDANTIVHMASIVDGNLTLSFSATQVFCNADGFAECE